MADTGFICEDCVLWHENRDDSGASEQWKRERLPRIDGTWIIDRGDGDPHFSDFPCYSCGEVLPGTRYSAVKVA